jgi:hypothetical protein
MRAPPVQALKALLYLDNLHTRRRERGNPTWLIADIDKGKKPEKYCGYLIEGESTPAIGFL